MNLIIKLLKLSAFGFIKRISFFNETIIVGYKKLKANSQK